jgi:translation initiation factor IF-3
LSRPFPSRYSREPLHRRNGKIRAREVRVLDETKQQLGVMSLNDALRLAMNKGLDLVEIAPNATPAVCRIVDYGKFMYEEAKKNKDSQGRQSASKMKELQLSPTIDPARFLDQAGSRHRLPVRGHEGPREAALSRAAEGAHRIRLCRGEPIRQRGRAWGQADSPPKMLGDRDLNVVLSPLPRNKRAKHPNKSETTAASEPPESAAPTEPPPAPDSGS